MVKIQLRNNRGTENTVTERGIICLLWANSGTDYDVSPLKSNEIVNSSIGVKLHLNPSKRKLS